MSDDNTPPSVDEIVHVPATDDTPVSPRQAADALLDFRRKRDAKSEEAPAKAAPEKPVTAKEAEVATPAEEATGEAPTETTEPAAEPTIEPPRSWTKDEKEAFKAYPRDLQETLARREQDRETHLRRSQNELAEQRKAFDAQRQQVEQARLQYEQALPQLLQTLHEQQQGEFADIKTMADVENLARNDFPRYAAWDAQQKKIAAIQSEVKSTEARQAQEFTQKWTEYTAKEDALLFEKAPELADPVKGKELAAAVIQILQDVGFSKEDLGKLQRGEASVSLRDHRLILPLLKAAKYDAAQKAVPAKVSKPVPPVQRPGTTAVKVSDDDVRIKNLEKKLEQTGSWKDAAALMQAKRTASNK